MGARSHDVHSVLDRLGDWCVNDWNTGGKLFEWKADSKGLPGGPVIKNPQCNSGDTGSILVRELRSHMLWGN